MFHKNGKETAIKLINKYADEYHVLEIENKNLKRINKDLKANIKINKEIINSFFKPLPFDEKTKELITSIQHENMFLSKLNKSSNQIITELNIKINELNRKLQTNISMYTEENEKLQTEIFNLKNIIILKDNKITSLKHKEKNHSNNSSTINITNCKIDTLCNFDIKEVYITNPTPVINSLNDEVISLKELLNKLNKHIAILKAKLKRYEKGIQMHEKEIAQYKEEINFHRRNNTNNKIISKMGYSSFNFTKINSKELDNKHSIINTTQINDNNNKSDLCSQMIEKLEKVNKSKQKMNKMNLTEEWADTLKFCNLTQEEYVGYCKIKKISKLTDAIEYLYKIIVDKNIQISLLIKENDCINEENIRLNKINLKLNEDINILKANCNLKGISMMMNKTTLIKDKDSSVFVNTSTSDIIRNNNNKKYLNTQTNKNSFIIDKREYSLTSSEFREGIVVDSFDIFSQVSKTQ